MIGRFLEYSLATPDIAASLDFYLRIGFSEAAVGEAWTHPYAVVTDGRLCLGLHQEPDFAASVTFVKPDLLKHLDRIEPLSMSLQIRRLGNDVFNEIGWLDPSGHLIRLVEARTFSPSKRAAADRSLCGHFQEIALPAANQESAKEYWERLGFVGIEEPGSLPHVSCTSDTINIGFHAPSQLREPALLFETEDLGGALERLAATGIAPEGRLPPSLRQLPVAVLAAPEGTLLLITAS